VKPYWFFERLFSSSSPRSKIPQGGETPGAGKELYRLPGILEVEGGEGEGGFDMLITMQLAVIYLVCFFFRKRYEFLCREVMGYHSLLLFYFIFYFYFLLFFLSFSFSFFGWLAVLRIGTGAVYNINYP